MSEIIRELSRFSLSLTDQIHLERITARYPFVITDYYASLIKQFDHLDPIYRQSFPAPEEELACNASLDPFCEKDKQYVPKLIHRYPNRAVLIVTNICAVHCRHCMRKRNWQEKPFVITEDEIRTAVKYCRDHQISDIILSGGDPFMAPVELLDYCIRSFADSPATQVIRIGTRLPATDPGRITERLASLCSLFPSTYVLTHFNHPNELTAAAREAVFRLRKAGAVVLNQNVLLKGVNDDQAILTYLYTTLLSWGVKPYYLHQCDLVESVTHFWVNPEDGITLLKKLQGNISGLALPYYAIDLPGGKGKILLGPETTFEKDGETYYFTTYTGERVAYTCRTVI